MPENINVIDKYVLSPFPTLLAACVLMAVFHEGHTDWLAEATFVGWFVNFYFWYRRNYRK